MKTRVFEAFETVGWGATASTLSTDARRVERRGTPKPFRVRQAEDSEAKAAIARAASELIGDDDAVIFDNGTTAQAIAQRLAGRPITAMCLSLHSAEVLGA